MNNDVSLNFLKDTPSGKRSNSSEAGCAVSLITVLVEGKYIAETFRIMFEYMWDSKE